jgi:hypothetical protein
LPSESLAPAAQIIARGTVTSNSNSNSTIATTTILHGKDSTWCISAAVTVTVTVTVAVACAQCLSHEKVGSAIDVLHRGLVDGSSQIEPPGAPFKLSIIPSLDQAPSLCDV